MQRPVPRLLLLLLSWGAAMSFCKGQNLPRQYEPVLFEKRASFGKIPPNWTFADSVFIHPEKAAPLKITPGNRLLVGKPGESISPSVNARNFRLYLGYTLTPGAFATVSLPGGATVVLSEGQHAQGDRMSGFTGQFPSQDAGKIAGLRQTLEIDYESEIAGLPGKARINEVKLNGVVVQQGQYLDSRPSPPSVSIQTGNGTVVFNAIGFQAFENRRPVALADLTYKIYNDEWDSRKTDMLGQSGTSPVLTFEVADGKKSYNLVYEGTLLVEENGDYNFTTLYTGAYCQLSIDGNVILDTDQSSSQETHQSNVRLDKGTYKIRLWYSKLPWAQAALGLRIGKKGIRDYDLHALSSLPEPPVKPFITVTPGTGKAEMVRSFIQLPSEKHKRTHCLSVGGPRVGTSGGRNFSVDLNRAALLQVWSGEFANTTEMWYRRGEPQVLAPLGLTEPVSARSSFVSLSTPDSPWIDSAAVGFLDYRVNAQGFPSIRYTLGSSIIEDAIAATDKGIKRTITPERNASAGNYVLLAEGSRITLLEKGLYLVDSRFYIKTNGSKPPVLRRSKGKAELLLPLAAPVTYSILW